MSFEEGAYKNFQAPRKKWTFPFSRDLYYQKNNGNIITGLLHLSTLFLVVGENIYYEMFIEEKRECFEN